MKNNNKVSVQNSISLKFLSVVLMMTLLISLLGSFNTAALTNDNASMDSVNLDTLKNTISDNRIIVMFDNQTSMSFIDHTISDFAHIGVKSVKNVTESVTELAKLTVQRKDTMTKSTTSQSIDFNISSYNKVLCVELNNGGIVNLNNAIKEIKKMDGVIYAGPDYKCQKTSASEPITNDTFVHHQWAISKIQLPQAWEINKNASDIIVAILDTGIDTTHPDLQGKVLTSYCRDFTKDRDNIDENDADVSASLPNDDDGHGTMVAGIIAANSNNYIGISGVCGDVKIVSLKVTRNGEGYLSDTLQAISYAQSIGADIINYSNSFAIGSGIGFNNPNIYYEDYSDSDAIFSSAISSFPGLFVCTAGNNNEYLDTKTDSIKPAQFTLDNMITVVASNSNDLIWDMSNYGRLTTDIYAPGESIIGCFPRSMCLDQTCSTTGTEHIYEGYHKGSGTSFAAPYVTGVAALLLSLNPELTNEQLKSIILNSVDSNETYECVSMGRLNAYKALDKLTNHTEHYMYVDAYPQNYLSQKHKVVCYSCELSYYEDHAMYVYSTENDSSIIKCRTCDYTIECNGAPEYGGNDETGHYVSCSCGCYSYFEPHRPIAIMQTSSLSTHNVLCRDCNTIYPVAHSWIPYGLGYECVMCAMTTLTIPEIMQIPSDGEISISSCDDHGTGVALLPEREDDFVTE
ncbi:MAG: S8 family serine peptidase [Clostridia bacterium]|nr:S8 family serine peptidase [Clostridia bacterium]